MKKPFPQSVVLDKTDTCLTYALKRTGFHTLWPKLTDSAAISDYFNRVPLGPTDFNSSYFPFEDGTILLWAEKERYQACPNEITEKGLIISHERLIGQHYGVYEGNSLISDCTISSKDYCFNRTIRMRNINDFPPTHYLTLK